MYLGITEEEFIRFSGACHCTLNTIYGDLSELYFGKPIPRADIIECVLDADRLLTYGESPLYRSRCRSGVHVTNTTWEVFYKDRIKPLVLSKWGTPEFKKTMKLVFKDAKY